MKSLINERRVVMINVIVEFKNGNVIQGQVSNDIWFNILWRELELDDTVSHYTAETVHETA